MNSTNRVYLLNRLWELQNSKGYLTDNDLLQLSVEFALSMVDIEVVVSFYHFFKRQPSGKFTIYLNNSILSYFNGFDEVKEAFEKETNTSIGNVDESGTFGLFETSCIGLADKEPAALINFCPFINLTPAKIKGIISGLKAGYTPKDLSDSVEERVRFGHADDKSILLRGFVPGKALSMLKDFSPEHIISIIKDSGLTGRGGAFFPTGMKWELSRKSAGSPKYIVCNADEGEPGSFKDRALLNLLPELLIEGMIIAGYAVGAEFGIIYLRAEYFWLLSKIEKTLTSYRNKGMLGKSIVMLKGVNFDIRVQMGAGAYICGEETALLESLEGKRGEPRLKTFFPTDKGFLGKPTVINNVETLCAVTRILELGVEKFKSGETKLLSIAGDCKYPGLYEIQWGMSVKELLEKAGAVNTMYIQISGPSGELISINEKERILSCSDIRCEGSIMIFNSERDLFSILENYSKFFTHESCGLCTPCRAGNPQLLKLIEKLKQGNATSKDIGDMLKLANIIKYNSRCGLGVTAPNSVINVIKKFPELIRFRIKEEIRLNPDFDLNKAIAEYNHLTDGE